MNIRNHQWITHGVIVLAVLLAALFIVSPVHAEGPTPPDPAPATQNTASDPAVVPDTAPAAVTPASDPAVVPDATPAVVTPPSNPAVVPDAAPAVVTPASDPAVVPDAAPAAVTPASDPAVVPDVAPAVVTPASDPAAVLDATPVVVTPTSDPVVVPNTEPTIASDPVVVPDAAPAEPTPVAEVAPAEEPVILNAVTTLAVNDITLAEPSGEPIQLGGRSSADMILTGDPYFTVGSITYRFMKPGGCSGLLYCSESSTPIQAALDYMTAHNLTPTDRKLYIGADTYSEDVWVEGNLNGVKGLTSLVGMGATPDDVQINGSLYIHDMLTGFSVSNLSVTDSIDHNDAAIWAWNNKGTLQFTDVNATATGEDSTGILVKHTGSVELNRVNTSGNGYNGARIWNTGSVKITNSTFDNNLNKVNDGIDFYDTQYDAYGNPIGQEPAYTGLDIRATGPVTLYGISVQGNIGDGADIDAGNSTISIKNSVFDHNDEGSHVDLWGDGLFIANGNIVTLENIEAYNNDLRGIASYVKTSFSGTHLNTQGNGWSGVWVDSCLSKGDPVCHNTGAGTVNIKTAFAISNGDNGFEIYAKGAITLTDLFSINNGNDGLRLDNSLAPTPAPITLNIATANNNFNGFELLSRGAITMSNFFAANNHSDGVTIDATAGTGAVTLTNIAEVFNETNNNDNNGYAILSKGPITITNVDTHDNSGGYGGYIDNSTATTAMPVTINVIGPSNYYDGFWNNAAGGLYINTRGAVTISHITVYDNKGIGAEIHNVPPGIAAGVPVTISDSWFDNNIIMDGNSDEDGLIVFSKGSITLLNIEASNNDGNGAHLNNQIPGATAGVTINAGLNKGNAFRGNYGNGLEIETNGAVTMTNIYATDNHLGHGVTIDNSSGTTGVTINQVGTFSGRMWNGNNYYSTEGNSFSSNSNDGLFITTRGAVTVNLFQARDNGNTGIEIQAGGGSGAVTINGTTNFWGNMSNNKSSEGILINAKGSITLTKIDASDNNGGDGAYLENDAGTGMISLTDAYFDRNGDSGLVVYSGGSVTWKNGSADDNFHNGAYIQNEVKSLAGTPVTITNVYANGNGETGLYIVSKGAVTLTDTQSCNNSADGYTINYGDHWLDNLNDNQVWLFNGANGDKVTIQVDSAHFNPNIYVTDPDGKVVAEIGGTAGSLTLKFSLLMDGQYKIHVGTDQYWNLWEYSLKLYAGITPPATWNEYVSSANGIYVDNRDGVNAGVTLTNATSQWNGNNSGTDVKILSSGAVSLTRMELNDSGQSGLIVNNTSSTTTPGVTLTSINFNNNNGDAADITTKGAVTINTAEVNGNGSYGYYILNNGGTVPSPITFTNVNVNNWGSSDTGVYLRSKGAVTLTNVGSFGNGGSGFDINTLGTVSFSGVKTWGNSEYGAYVITPNTFTVNAPAIGFNNFDNNRLDGLYVEAGGKITMTKVDADNNGWRDEITGHPLTDAYGIYLDSTNTAGTAPISLTNVISNGNTLDGTHVFTTSPVTITTLQANNNTNFGLYIDQTTAPSSLFPVTLSKISTGSNGMDGMYVEVKGNIIVNKFDVNFNQGSGAVLLNNLGTGTVTILNALGGNSSLVNTGGSGVYIESNGAVNVTGLETGYNGVDGLDVHNNYLSITPLVTLNSVISRNNTQNGIYVGSKGVVTVNNSWALSNGHDGIGMDIVGNVFMNNTSAINNDWAGFYINGSSTTILRLTNSTWFGNLRNDPNPGDHNLMLLGGGTLIII